MRKRNRILMLLENLPFPMDVRVRREANALHAAGYRVTVICPARNGQPFRETVNGVRVLRYPPPAAANGFLAYVWEYGYSMLASFLLSVLVFFGDGFDVVHAHNPPDTFVFIGVFYKLFGKRFIYDHHDLSPEMYQARFPGGGNPIVYRVLVWLEKLTCRRADHVIVTNESYKRIAMNRCRVQESRISIVRNGVELSRLHSAIEPHPDLRSKQKTIIGYVGVMGIQDGVDYLLRALRHLVRDLGRTDFFCVLVGGGDAFESLKSMTEQFGLTSHVLFTGMVGHSKVAGYLSAADICVAPEPSASYNDLSTAVKLTEYMSLGKPIVAFALTEHRYTAQGAAAYVNPNDEMEFARTISDLMDDPARRRAMGQLGLERMETELAWDFSVPRLLEAYRAVLPTALSPSTIFAAGNGNRKPVPMPSTGPISREKQGDVQAL